LPRTSLKAALISTLLIIFALGVGAAQAAQSVDLIPHRALYKMSLVSASRGSGIADATGTMLYSFNDGCEAWASETNVNLKLVYAEGGEVETNWSFASWEAKDGTAYRFRVRHTRDGNLVENLKGTVRRADPAAASEARYSLPKDKLINLPEGTLFPTRHLLALIAAGQTGRPVFSRTVFDGASMDNPYEINAIIGRDRMATSPAALAAGKLMSAAGLKQHAVRHVRMAFFPRGSMKPEPEFELGVDYRADGIARAIRQDFGDFTVDLTPATIEPLKRPGC